MATTSYAMSTLERHQVLAKDILSILNFNSSKAAETLYSSYVNKIINEINEEIRNVNHLELRMTIVAPMKSGKSTIINALIGDNILPTRADAMTTVPTEVIFRQGTKEPTLFLSKEAIDTMNEIHENVRGYLLVKVIGEGETIKLFENESHMNKLVDEILNNNKIGMLQNQIVGSTQIQNTLLVINDLVRLYLKLTANQNTEIKQVNFQAFQKEIPRIEVPFVNSIVNNVGSLVIVDTPGPNEALMCGQLQEIVTSELRKAGVILVIFNYTVLNTEADEKIMQEIAELREINGNYDCIYAIINKVDQRRKGDMSKEDVKNFIATKYKIEELSTNDENDRRIFETKAIFGLTSKRFLVEYERLKEKNTDPTIQNMQTIDDLGSELYDWKWETERETITLEQLYKGALDMWKKSGLDELLQCTVGSLMKRIESHIAESALSKCQRIDRELIKYLKLRQTALDADEQKLNAEAIELEHEMVLIQHIQSQQRMSLEPYLTTLNSRIKEIDSLHQIHITELMSKWEPRKDWKYHLLENKFSSGVLLGGLTTFGCLVSGLLAGALVGGIPAITLGTYHWLWDNMSNSIRFPYDDGAAEKFCDEVTEMIFILCNGELKQICEHINADCKRMSEDLYYSLRGKTSHMLERAEKILNVTFEIKQPVIEPFVMDFTKSSVEKIRLSPNTNPLYPEYKSFISREDLIKQCNQLITKNFVKIQQAIKDWSRTSLESSYTNYLNELTTCLNMYVNYVESSLDDVKLNKTDQENFRQSLQQSIDKLNAELQNLITT
jgi:GTPase SAR1 family protein